MSMKITTAQRAAIQLFLREAEYDSRTVTIMHRNVGVAERFIGASVDEWLDSLTAAEASRLIVKLEQITS